MFELIIYAEWNPMHFVFAFQMHFLITLLVKYKFDYVDFIFVDPEYSTLGTIFAR